MISLFKKLLSIPLIVMVGSFIFMKFSINDFIFQPDTVLTWVLSCLVASIIVMFSSFILLMKTEDNKFHFYLGTLLVGAFFAHQRSFTLERWGIIGNRWEVLLIPVIVSLMVYLVLMSMVISRYSTTTEKKKEEKQG